MKKTPTLFLVSFFLIYLIIINNASAQAPVWNWAADAGGVANAHDKGQNCVTDAAGNLYVTGFFYSPVIMFDSVSLNNTSVNFKADIFLAKYNSSGNLQWVKKAGGTDNDMAVSCALDPNGNIIIAGYFTSPVLTVGGFQVTNSGFEDIFVAQFNPAGIALWAKSFGGAAADVALSVASDSIGSAFISGYFESPDIIFDGDTLHNTGAFDLFVVKFGITTGTVGWARSATGSDYDGAYACAADASGNVYVGAYYASSPLTIGSNPLANQGAYDLFVAKYDGSGNLQWVNEAGGTESDVAKSIALDQSGNVYLTGYFGSPSMTFGNTTLAASGRDMFIASFDNAGIDRWASSAGGPYGDEGNGVCSDFSGNVYVTGDFESPSITIGSTTLTNAGSFTEDGFITAYDNNGNNLWAKGLGGGDEDVANAVCADQQLNVYITGYYGSNSLLLDGITLNNATAAPYQDVFMAKLSSYVGVSENIVSENDVIIFPNPATSQLAIGSLQFAINKIEIVDQVGRIVFNYQPTASTQQFEINISELPAGVYFIRIKTDKNIFVEKLVKQ